MDTPKTLNVRGLPKSKVDYLKQLISQWRQEAEHQVQAKDLDEEVVFAMHESKVVGPLTRREIYDDV